MRMIRIWLAVAGCAGLLSTAPLAWGQQIQPPLIVGGESTVLVDGQPQLPRFLKINDGQVVRTTQGRATLLPRFSVVLIMDQNSSVKVLDAMHCELESGSVIVHVLRNRHTFAIRDHDALVTLDRKGFYRVDASPGILRVYDGEAAVNVGAKRAQVSKAGQMELNAALVASTFDPKDRDAFYAAVTAPLPDHGILATVPCYGQVFRTGVVRNFPADDTYCLDPEIPPSAR